MGRLLVAPAVARVEQPKGPVGHLAEVDANAFGMEGVAHPTRHELHERASRRHLAYGFGKAREQPPRVERLAEELAVDGRAQPAVDPMEGQHPEAAHGQGHHDVGPGLMASTKRPRHPVRENAARATTRSASNTTTPRETRTYLRPLRRIIRSGITWCRKIA